MYHLLDVCVWFVYTGTNILSNISGELQWFQLFIIPCLLVDSGWSPCTEKKTYWSVCNRSNIQIKAASVFNIVSFSWTDPFGVGEIWCSCYAVWGGMVPEVDRLYRSCDMWVILGPAQQTTRIKHSLIGSLTHWFMGTERQQDFCGYTYSRDVLHGSKWLATFNLTMTLLGRWSSKMIKWFP